MKARFQPKYNIKKGDQVVVIAGDDKNLTTPRAVIAVIPDAKNPKVLVEGVALATKHKKPNAQNPQGAIVKEEAYISLSNVMLWDAKAGAGTKVKRDRTSGKAVRISKKTNQAI
jgi:large subunit ribosomal protein L24